MLSFAAVVVVVVGAGCAVKDNDPKVVADSGNPDTGSSSGGLETEGVPCSADDVCDDGNVCNGVERCSSAMICEAGEPPQGPTSCGADGVCVAGACVSANCGNGVIEPGEQCDDGNAATFDGCDPTCRYELFYRSYELNLMPSPAGSFCDRPDSALGDALSDYALEANNAAHKSRIDAGLTNSVFQLLDLDDLTGATDGMLGFRQATGVLDPAKGPWPADGSNPIDWWILVDEHRLAPDGTFGDQIAEVVLRGGRFIGGPGISAFADPQFRDSAVRARFDTSTTPDRPAPPPAGLAEGQLVAQEVHGDGEDEGICGNLTASSMAVIPVDPGLVDCLDCPGISHSYHPCPGNEVTAECNSSLDALVGGCVVGTCETPTVVIIPTQPDVDHGGPAPLVLDEANFLKIPDADAIGNPNGYSAYFQFRARRVHVTGVNPE